MEPHHHRGNYCYSASEMGSPFAAFTTFANSNHHQSAQFSARQTFEYVSQHTDIMSVRSHREINLLLVMNCWNQGHVWQSNTGLYLFPEQQGYLNAVLFFKIFLLLRIFFQFLVDAKTFGGEAKCFVIHRPLNSTCFWGYSRNHLSGSLSKISCSDQSFFAKMVHATNHCSELAIQGSFAMLVNVPVQGFQQCSKG